MPDPQSEPSLNRSIGLVIFDLDGVLCDWHPHRRLEFLSQLSGRDSEWIRRTIFDSAFETAAETGAYPTGEAYLAGFNQQLGFALSRQQWVTARQAAMQPRPAMLGLVRALLRHVSVAVLTNNGALLRETLPDLIPDLHALLGQHIHVTCDLGARKPDPTAFLRLLDHYRRLPEESLFIDDSERNVQGARAAGLQGLLFTGEPDLIEQLKARFADIG